MLIQKIISESVNPIRNQLHLSGDPVFMPLGSPYKTRLHNLADEISDSINIREIPIVDSEQLFRLVSIGFCDFAVCDEQVAHAYSERFRHIDTKTPLSFSQFNAWAVNKGNYTLLDSLNGFISTYKKSPAFARLSKKYLVNN
jgi:membrane-bound lytic murein transglycosylase F